MEDLRSDQDLKSRYDQLLFIECELWCLHSKDFHLYPLLSETFGKGQSQSCVKSQTTSSDVSKFSSTGDERYFVEVNLLSVNSSGDNLENSTGYTALIFGDYLEYDSLKYSRQCTDLKALSEKLRNQSVLNLERIQRLMCYFLSCCQSGNCKCYLNAINGSSCIVAWNPSKIQALLGSCINNDNEASMRNFCSNNLLYKLRNTINLNEIVRPFLSNTCQISDSTDPSEIINQVNTTALSIGASERDLAPDKPVDVNLPLGGYTDLLCKNMAIIGLILTKEPYLFRFTMDSNLNSENVSHPNCDETFNSQAVRLRGLPWKTEVDDIIFFFTPVCSITEAEVAILYNSEGRMSGEAYVLLPSIQAYETSLTILHGKKMGKRWIEVIPSTIQEFLICKEISGLTKSQDSPKFSQSSPEIQPFDNLKNRSVLRLRGLPWTTTESDIVEFFKIAGISNIPTSDIFLGINDDQRPSGDGWVILPAWCDANEAQRILNKKMIGKRYIEVFTSSIAALSSSKSTFNNKVFERDCNNNTTVLRVRGLPYTITESEIFGFFGGFRIAGIAPVLQGRNEMRPSGQMLIKFATVEDAFKAYLTKNMGMIHNRYIELFPVKEEDFVAANKRNYRKGSNSRSNPFSCYSTTGSSSSVTLKNYMSIGTNLTGSTMEGSLTEQPSNDFTVSEYGSDR
ncbi:hypothetical protein FG386_002237 [Cryptosporidium ryanae]|uniref:uncharacterized protein n=1 Tax=Cryptosporidium ryanae TaxID=515981 RepID=UPI003519E57F|nr:hypothetical protein FG386_002237 [Cryptosporidium ryanae]